MRRVTKDENEKRAEPKAGQGLGHRRAAWRWWSCPRWAARSAAPPPMTSLAEAEAYMASRKAKAKEAFVAKNWPAARDLYTHCLEIHGSALGRFRNPTNE